LLQAFLQLTTLTTLTTLLGLEPGTFLLCFLRFRLASAAKSKTRSPLAKALEVNKIALFWKLARKRNGSNPGGAVLTLCLWLRCRRIVLDRQRQHHRPCYWRCNFRCWQASEGGVEVVMVTYLDRQRRRHHRRYWRCNFCCGQGSKGGRIRGGHGNQDGRGMTVTAKISPPWVSGLSALANSTIGSATSASPSTLLVM